MAFFIYLFFQNTEKKAAMTQSIYRMTRFKTVGSMSSDRNTFHKTIEHFTPVLRKLQIYGLDALRVLPFTGEEKVLARNCTLGVCILPSGSPKSRSENLWHCSSFGHGIGLHPHSLFAKHYLSMRVESRAEYLQAKKMWFSLKNASLYFVIASGTTIRSYRTDLKEKIEPSLLNAFLFDAVRSQTRIKNMPRFLYSWSILSN